MKKITLILISSILTFSLHAQDLDTKLASKLTIEKTVSDFMEIKKEKKSLLTANEFDRQMRRFSYTDSTITRSEINREARITPGILWGLGGGVAYYGLNIVLFGGAENAGITGLLVSTLGGVAIGAIVNSSKREKAKQRILNRRMQQ